MTTRYVNQHGLLASNRLRLQDFSLNRLLKVSFLIALLVLTNPAHIHSKFSSSRKSIVTNLFSNEKKTSKRFQSEWLGIDIHIDFKNTRKKWGVNPVFTNYFLFSLTKQQGGRGVNVGILMNEFAFCKYDGIAPEICQWILSNACHEMKMFDPNYRPFTALRIVQMIKLTSFLLQQCYNCGTLCPSALGYRYGHSFLLAPVSAILSTLHQPIWYNDLLLLNAFVYPFLELLDRTTRAGTSGDDTASLHFYGLEAILIFIVGGAANFAAESMTNEAVRGMKGSIASALGYYCASKPSKIILHWAGMDLTSGDIFFGLLAVTSTSIILGFGQLLGSWRMSDSIAWGAGGFLGYLICRLQLEQYNIWWWSY
jgi:hypothetical protein